MCPGDDAEGDWELFASRRESDLVSRYTYIPVCVNPAAAIDKKRCQYLDSNGHVSECDRCVDFFFLSGVQTLCIDLCLRLYIV